MVFLLSQVVFFLLYSQATNCQSLANNQTLRFVHALFRHGDRNPIFTFPLDKENQPESWDGGLGELTTLGIRQHYDLGKFMKKRYKGFLSEDYKAREISAQSTHTNRTIVSALSFLAGMFPPSGRQLWNKEIPWQPIPVHSTPKELEKIAHNDTHKRPERATDKVFLKIREIYRTRHEMWYGRSEVKRLYSGLLVHEIARKMINIKSNNGTSTYNPLKYQAYFAHDFNQVALLQNLGVFDGSLPTYGQAILIEMHEKFGHAYVKIYKKNDTIIGQHTLIPLCMPDCSDPCPVKKFYDLSLKTKPDNWEKECGI